jgi:hypothetical protein
MYRSLAVTNPRISADQPSLARGVARSSDRETKLRKIKERDEAGYVCLLDN